MIKNAELLRVERSREDGTIGNLFVDEKLICLSLEPFDCIAEGTYHVVADDTGRWRYYRVLDVIGFTNIEFHTGNTIHNTKGCILTGTGIYWLGEQRGVSQSQKAMDMFQKALGGVTEFTLVIKAI